MNAAVITVILNSLQAIIPSISTSATIANIIKILSALIPVLIQGYQELLPIVQNIITLLTQSTDVTDDQIKELQALSAAIDAHFDATLAAARAADALAAIPSV